MRLEVEDNRIKTMFEFRVTYAAKSTNQIMFTSGRVGVGLCEKPTHLLQCVYTHTLTHIEKGRVRERESKRKEEWEKGKGE